MDLTMYFKKSMDKSRDEGWHKAEFAYAKQMVEFSRKNEIPDEVIKRELTRKYPDLSPEELKDIVNEYQLN